jgi:hypothetical protein
MVRHSGNGYKSIFTHAEPLHPGKSPAASNWGPEEEEILQISLSESIHQSSQHHSSGASVIRFPLSVNISHTHDSSVIVWKGSQWSGADFNGSDFIAIGFTCPQILLTLPKFYEVATFPWS